MGFEDATRTKLFQVITDALPDAPRPFVSKRPRIVREAEGWVTNFASPDDANFVHFVEISTAKVEPRTFKEAIKGWSYGFRVQYYYQYEDTDANFDQFMANQITIAEAVNRFDFAAQDGLSVKVQPLIFEIRGTPLVTDQLPMLVAEGQILFNSQVK